MSLFVRLPAGEGDGEEVSCAEGDGVDDEEVGDAVAGDAESSFVEVFGAAAYPIPIPATRATAIPAPATARVTDRFLTAESGRGGNDVLTPQVLPLASGR